MRFIKIKTRKFLPPKDDLFQLLNSHLPKLKEGDVLFVTSKILAIHQGRCVKITASTDKKKIVRREAEKYIPGNRLTIKDHTIIGSSGVDESNSGGYYTLWPKNSEQLLKKVWTYLTRKHGIKKLGLIATDTRPNPLRYGATGICISAFGFEPLIDYRGRRDLFKRQLKFTRVNLPDSLAPMATLLMGESNEQTPLLILRGAKMIKFTSKPAYKNLLITKEADTFAPLLKIFKSAK